MTYEQLLVAIDFSHCSANALKEAVRLASHDKAKVTAVHVLDQEVIKYLQEHTVLDETATEQEALSRLEAFVSANIEDDQATIEAIVVTGHPFNQLVSVAKEKSADLLLLGTRGHGEDDRRIGAIASKCLRKAPFPVMVVQDLHGHSFQQIVCCVDFSPTSKQAVKAAIHMAALEQASLDFVHVYASPNIYQDTNAPYIMTGYGDPNDFAQLMRQNLANFLSPFEDDMSGIQVTQSLIDRIGAGAGITDHVRDLNADLVILGTRGRSGWNKLLLGTTAEHVIHRVACSTLTIKPDDFTYEP